VRGVKFEMNHNVVIPPEISKSLSRLKFRKFIALLNIAYYGFRPIISPILFSCWLINSYRNWQAWSKTKQFISSIFGGILVLELIKLFKDRFSWTWRTRQNIESPKEGLIHYKSNNINTKNEKKNEKWNKMKRVLDSTKLNYSPPLWSYIGGDITTFLPTSLHSQRSPNWNRKRTNDNIDLDFLYPKENNNNDNNKNQSKIAILLPGVGGGSDSGYVIDVANVFIIDNWTICVINARGMGNQLILHIV
jgi:hypothetical protein